MESGPTKNKVPSYHHRGTTVPMSNNDTLINFLRTNTPFAPIDYNREVPIVATAVSEIASASLSDEWDTSVAVVDPNLISNLRNRLQSKLRSLNNVNNLGDIPYTFEYAKREVSEDTVASDGNEAKGKSSFIIESQF